MNDSQFGLTASIWTKDVSKGHELIDDVEAGTVFVNRCDYPAPVSNPRYVVWRILTTTGSRLGWMERLWKGTDVKQVRI
jgi:acyl-CoA reductase-like NAD-dependent aldehyde dehydrogenase